MAMVPWSCSLAQNLGLVAQAEMTPFAIAVPFLKTLPYDAVTGTGPYPRWA